MNNQLKQDIKDNLKIFTIPTIATAILGAIVYWGSKQPPVDWPLRPPVHQGNNIYRFEDWEFGKNLSAFQGNNPNLEVIEVVFREKQDYLDNYYIVIFKNK